MLLGVAVNDEESDVVGAGEVFVGAVAESVESVGAVVPLPEFAVALEEVEAVELVAAGAVLSARTSASGETTKDRARIRPVSLRVLFFICFVEFNGHHFAGELAARSE